MGLLDVEDSGSGWGFCACADDCGEALDGSDCVADEAFIIGLGSAIVFTTGIGKLEKTRSGSCKGSTKSVSYFAPCECQSSMISILRTGVCSRREI